MKTKNWIQTLIDIKNNYPILPSEKETINIILQYFNKMYTKRKYKKSPNPPFKVRSIDIKRVGKESLSKQILYTMQLNKTPVSFRNLTNMFNNTSQHISVSLNFLIKIELIKRINYATYELTEKGKDYVV